MVLSENARILEVQSLRECFRIWKGWGKIFLQQ